MGSEDKEKGGKGEEEKKGRGKGEEEKRGKKDGVEGVGSRSLGHVDGRRKSIVNASFLIYFQYLEPKKNIENISKIKSKVKILTTTSIIL